MKKGIWLVLMGIILAGCSPLDRLPIQEIPAPFRVSVTPSTAYWAKAVSDCTASLPNVLAVVDVQPAREPQTGIADLVIQSGDAGTESAFSLGEDNLVFIVHPKNPITALSMEQAQQIYLGFSLTWGDVQANLPTEWQTRMVTAFSYAASDEFAQLFLHRVLNDSPEQFKTLQAPSPAEVVQEVASNPSAIGYIPRKWLVSQVKVLSPEPAITFPLVMSAVDKPENNLVLFMSCLSAKQ